MIRWVTKFVDWFLFTSLFTACCATGLCMSTEKLAIGHIPPIFSPLHTLVFGATLAVYNIHVLLKRSTPEQSDLYGWALDRKYWLYIALALGIISCFLSMFLMPPRIIIISCIMGILAIAYSAPVLPFSKMKRIRDIGILKILVLAGVWTMATTALPLLYHNVPLTRYPYEIVIRLVFIFTLCVAFDVRDIQTDIDARVNTVPVLIGVKRSYQLIDFGVVLFALLGAVQYINIHDLERFAGVIVTALVTKRVLEYTADHPSDRSYMGLVDGLMVLYTVLVLMH